MREPSESSLRLPRWAVLLGACVGVPVPVAAIVASLTAAASCDTNGLVLLGTGAVAAFVLGWAWAFGCGARRGWLVANVAGGGMLGTLAALVAWLEVAFDRCFTF
jgi:hypothetical protein